MQLHTKSWPPETDTFLSHVEFLVTTVSRRVFSIFLSSPLSPFPFSVPWAAFSCSVMSSSLWPHELQASRPHCTWGFSRYNSSLMTCILFLVNIVKENRDIALLIFSSNNTEQMKTMPSYVPCDNTVWRNQKAKQYGVT